MFFALLHGLQNLDMWRILHPDTQQARKVQFHCSSVHFLQTKAHWKFCEQDDTAPSLCRNRSWKLEWKLWTVSLRISKNDLLLDSFHCSLMHFLQPFENFASLHGYSAIFLSWYKLKIEVRGFQRAPSDTFYAGIIELQLSLEQELWMICGVSLHWHLPS